MDKIIRCITSDGSLMASAIDSSDLVYEAQALHKLTKTTAAALGRLLTGASIMGAMLKNTKSKITITINGGGPIGNLVVKADAYGNVRGYVNNPQTDLPVREGDGKINVGAAVGKEGRFTLIRDEGEGEPYITHVELISGEIAEDIAGYYAYSEQIPTVCALGVLTDKADGQVLLSGGLLVQVLPGADPTAIDRLEENVSKLLPMTTLLAQGKTPMDICEMALDGFEVEVLDSFEVKYVCNCSKERIAEMLLTLGPEEIKSLPLNDDGMAGVACQFCSRNYYFSQEELNELADSINPDKQTKS